MSESFKLIVLLLLLPASACCWLQSIILESFISVSLSLSLKWLQALEKAVGDTIPSSARKIEPIVKKVSDRNP